MATPNLNLDHIVGAQNNKEVTANAAFDGLDNAMNTVLEIAVTGSTFLTPAQLRSNAVFRLTGTPGSNFELEIPVDVMRAFSIANDTDSEATIVLADTGGATYSILAGGTGSFSTDGVLLFRFAAVASGGGGTVDVQDDGAGTFTPDTLNFTGGGVTVTNAGSGVATIDIPGGNITFREATSTADFVDSDFDGNKGVRANSGSAITLTIPAGLTPTGAMVVFRQGSGTVTIDAESGVDLLSADSQFNLRAQYSMITIVQLATDQYILIGDLAA